MLASPPAGTTDLVLQITGRHGRFSFRSDDVYIGRSLAVYGEYSEGEVQLFRHFVDLGSTVLDVGANIGSFTVPLAQMATHVIAIEAHPENAALLRANVGANGLSNVVVIEAAAGAVEGKTTMPSLDDVATRNFGGISVGHGDLDVPLIAIDDHPALEGVRVDFIKIDVEGHERDVLIGATGVIADYHPVLYVECDRPHKAQALLQTLRRLGYNRIWNHQPALFNPDNHFGNLDNVFGNIVSCNLLCLHDDDERTIGNQEQIKFLLTPVPVDGAATASPAVMTKKWAGVCRLGGVGDNLIAASVLGPLKRLGYMVEVITEDPHHVVFENNPHIDKLAVKKGPRDLPQNDMMAWQKWFAGRSNEYDRFANLSHSCESLTAMLPAQSAFWWPQEARRQLCNRNYLEVVHDILGVPHEFGPLFFPTDAEKERAANTKAEVGGRCIGWVLSGTRLDKIYPYAAMAVARIIRETGIAVVMMGAPGKDFAMAKAIMEHVERQNGTHDGLHLGLSPDPANPSWPIRRVLTMAAACDLVVGPDTGPMWGVAFEPVPKVMLLSHASPENVTKHWINTTTLHAIPDHVPCWPCHRLHDTPDTCTPNKDNLAAACMSDISVETILKTVSKMLGK